MEGAQLLGIRGDALGDAVPRDARVAVHVLFETGFERFQKSFLLIDGECFHGLFPPLILNYCY